MNPLHILIAAWLSLFGPNNDVTKHLIAHQHLATAIEAAAVQHNVPPALLLTLGVMESRLGFHVPNGGEWGVRRAYIVAACRDRHVGCGMDRIHAQIEVGAMILADGFNHCGSDDPRRYYQSWRAAARYYNTGKCAQSADAHNYGGRAVDLMRRIERKIRQIQPHS